MTLELGVTLVPAFAILFIGAVVFFHDRKSATNLLFFFMSISTLLWSFVNYMSVTAPLEESLLWIRLVLFFAAPHALFFALFVYNFPSKELQIRKRNQYSLGTLLTATMLATISPYVFTSIVISEGDVTPVAGPLMPLFAITVVGSLLFALVFMIKKYVAADESDRKNWRVMLAGTAISYFLLIFTNFVLVVTFRDTSFNLYGPLFMLPTFLAMTYAILRHNVLNIKAVAAEILTFLILVVSLFEIFLATSTQEIILKILIFVAFFIFGILLIKSVLKEVSQREKIEELAKSLEKANKRLTELDRLKSEFVSIASHQLRSPLTAIKGYASLILEGSFGKVNDAVTEATQKIFDSSKLMAVSVQDFLDVSKIEQGKMNYNFEEFDLEKLLCTVVEELTHTAKEKGLNLTLKITSEGGYEVKADIGKIKQVLYNLIDNSIKYTPDGSVNVLMHHVEGKIRIEIHDTGVGIAKETLPKLFEKFVRSRNAHHVNVSGSGLGLFVVKEMVEAHKGKVWATSDGEGRGSTFHVELAKTINDHSLK